MLPPTNPPIARIVGTAGHVDHGKSSLVQALTGTDPDRLAEEKSRAMTIELGFAWKLASDRFRLSFIDVPGHERFIKNMLAGVGGIDAVMLVIAADEGPMPQTREHLAIIDLLGIRNGVVALSKADLVDDDWRELVIEETRAALHGSTLADVPIIPCSARTGQGLAQLEQELLAQCHATPSRIDRGRPRLSIDRVFTLAGFGTVVTGTLIDGGLRAGEEIELLPAGIRTRIRGLHVHDTRVDQADPGTRVAVNLAGIPLEQIHRGDLLTRPDLLGPSQRIDIRLHLLQTAPPLHQDDPVDLFAGAAETGAWVSLLDRDELSPGDTGWVQLRTRRPVTLVAGDRVIIRRPSPSDTIGGGVVVDPASSRHRRLDATVIGSLTARERGDPEELILRALEQQILRCDELTKTAGSATGTVVDDLAERQLLIRLEDGLLTSRRHWDSLKTRAVESVNRYHEEQPRRRGMPRDALRNRLTPGKTAAFDRLMSELVAENQLVDTQRTLRHPAFEVRLDPAERTSADRWLAAIDETPFSPPPPDEFGITPATLQVLLERDELVLITEQIALTPRALLTVETGVLRIVDTDGRITLSSYRDRFESSRKYAQAMLEYFDRRRITRRVGDDRVRFRSNTGEQSREEKGNGDQ